MMNRVIEGIETERKALQALPPQIVLNAFQMAVLFGAVCLKHPGFAEEAEQRVIHLPSIPIPSLLRRREIGAAPAQTIFEIPLEDAPGKGLVGLTPDALIDQVIIGPSARTLVIRAGLEAALSRAGVTDPAGRIFMSGIPLRV